MDDDFSALLNLHNSFGFFQDSTTTLQDSTPPDKTCQASDIRTTETSNHGDAVPDFISDHGTPNSPLSSLITPTDPLSGMFRYPPSHNPFPSDDWFPPHPNSACTPFAYPNPPLNLHAASPYPHQPTWGPVLPANAGFADHINSTCTPFAYPNPPLHLHAASPYPHQSTWGPVLPANAGFTTHIPHVMVPHTAAQYEVPVPTLPYPTFAGMFDPYSNGSNNPASSSCEGNKPTSNGKGEIRLHLAGGTNIQKLL
jgi:hypothetical protein